MHNRWTSAERVLLRGSMILCFMVIAFFATVVTGPAGVEYLEARRARRDRPLATVHYLPSSACRSGGTDPVLVAVRRRRYRESVGCDVPCSQRCSICDD